MLCRLKEPSAAVAAYHSALNVRPSDAEVDYTLAIHHTGRLFIRMLREDTAVCINSALSHIAGSIIQLAYGTL